MTLMTAFEVGDLTVRRISYAEVTAPAERVGLTSEQVRSVPWAEPTWAVDGEVRIGVAAWVIERGDERIVVEPANVADEILRSDADAATHQEAFAAALAAGGVTRDNVTAVVSTHLDGIGMLAWREDDGTWTPFFRDAPIYLSQRELDGIDDGTHKPSRTEVLAELRACGAVRPVLDERFEMADDVVLELTGGHSPGHQAIRIGGGARNEQVVIVGHLAVTPMHLVTGPCPQQHPDPRRADDAMTALRDEGGILIGPLWPSPGAGQFVDGELVTVPI
jgi:glyoxylase-like metal-dependent hydrolase (beta-lactamase superfamily II)